MLQRTHLLFVLAALLLLGGVMGWAHQPVVLAEPANYDCAAQSAIPETECEALVAIYEANPDGLFSGWLANGSSPCNWTGVICLEGEVIEIWLFDSQLTVLPPQIEQLSNVQGLYLSGNQLTDVPTELSQLNNLQKLHLGSTQLATIPTMLWQLSNLQELDLSFNGFTAIPDGIESLSNLAWLDLSGNQLTALPTAIGQMSNLMGISASQNQLTSVPAELWQLTNLQLLQLGANQFTVIPIEIGQLSNLQWLYLYDNQLTAVPTEIGQLSNLQRLNLDNNQLTEMPAEVWQLSNLQSLGLSNIQLTAVPAEIGQLSNLHTLDLSKNALTAVPAEIGQLSNLKWLFLSSNQLCALPLAITNLTPNILYVNNNHLAPTDPSLLTWLDTYQPHWHTVQTACPFTPSVTLSAPTDALTITIGQSVTYTVHITNTGDAHDTFALTATNQTWTTILPPSINLAEGTTDTFVVQVQVPLTATHDAQDSVLITVVSGISETVTSMIDLTTTAVVPPGHRIYLPLITR